MRTIRQLHKTQKTSLVLRRRLKSTQQTPPASLRCQKKIFQRLVAKSCLLKEL